MIETVRHYASEAIDVTYEARRCLHAAECLGGLPAVSNTAGSRGSCRPAPSRSRR